MDARNAVIADASTHPSTASDGRGRSRRLIAVGLAALPFVSSCLAMGGGDKTLFDESQRYSVRFANRNASHAFYEGLGRADRDDYTDGGGFVVLFLAGGGGSVFHETPFYNAQVRRADVDRDGEITEEEALDYLAQVTAERE